MKFCRTNREKVEESSTNESDEPLKVVLTEQIINEVLEKSIYLKIRKKQSKRAVLMLFQKIQR